MRLSLERHRFAAYSVAVLAASGGFALWVSLGIGGQTATLWFDDTATPLAALVACLLCVRARARDGAQLRRFWTLLAAATACWSAAELIWGYYALIRGSAVPVPSWADVGYLGAIPLTIAALVTHPALRASGTRSFRHVFEGLLVATALLFTSWTLVLASIWRNTDLSTVGGVVSIAYPFGDVVIVFFIVLAIHRMSGERRMLWCLLAGLLAMALSDSTYAYLTATSSYASPGLIDTGWVAAYLAIGLSALSSRRSGPAVVKPERSTPTLASLVAPIAPVLLALALATVEIRLGDHLGGLGLGILLALIGLVLARQALVVRELVNTSRGQQGGMIAGLAQATLGDAQAQEAGRPGISQ